MTLNPAKHTSKDAGVHTFQDDRLKHSINKPMNMYTCLQENIKLLTSTSFRDHATSMFTRLAISVNCDHNWFTSSYGPPNRNVSISDDISQQLAMSHQGPQIRPQLNSRQRDTRDPALPEDLRGCALFAAPVHFHLGGFFRNPKPANQETPVSIAGHGQNA